MNPSSQLIPPHTHTHSHTNRCSVHTVALRRSREHIRACVDKRDAAIMEKRLRWGIVARRKAESQSEGRRKKMVLIHTGRSSPFVLAWYKETSIICDPLSSVQMGKNRK